MQMWASREAGRSYKSYHCAGGYDLSHRNRRSREVAVSRLLTAAMVDRHKQAITAGPSGADDLARSGCENRCSRWRSKVNPAVAAHTAQYWMGAHAEGAGQHC